MRGQPSDRRVRRTRRRLKEALLELIDEKGYERITIREITDRADVGRSTFYSHYDSKEDLLFAGFDDWLLSLAEAAGPPGGEGDRAGGRRFRFSLPLLEHARGQRRFFEAVMVRGAGARLRRRITDLLAEAARRELARDATTPRLAYGTRSTRRERERLRGARAHAVAGAFLGILGWWLEAGRGLSAEDVDGIFQTTVGGVSSNREEA